MATETSNAVSVDVLRDKATLLRIDSVRATTEAGSGHPTSCASAADIVSVLFFSVMRYDPRNPKRPENDTFVLSKGHAAPLLYAAWAEAGAIPRDELVNLRKIDSRLEGHPTPRLPFVKVATGSLGQGLSAAVGIASSAMKLRHLDNRIYVLIGDGESAEGSNWEAADWAAHQKLSNLCVTLDINRLGQSQPTMLQHNLDAYKARWEAFGWQALSVDGHNIPELQSAYERAANTKDRPTVVLARTLKGKGLPEIEGKDNWHGKPLDPETSKKVIAELEKSLTGAASGWQPNLPPGAGARDEPVRSTEPAKPPYQIGGKATAPRRAFGDALAALGKADPRVVVVDGDVKNSTYTDEFEKVAPERFFQAYIAEQNMTGMAMGLAASGHTAFAATFACFLTRAYDFIRMASISDLNVKFVGTHAGISIGEDGPSQMGLEDLACMCAQPGFTVLYPTDATSSWQATWLIAGHQGPCYLRAGRPNAPILYGPGEPFEIGKCKVLRRSDQDRALIVAAGVTVFEALAAHDQLKQEGIAVRVIDLFSIQPIDQQELVESARACGGNVITVEDHYEHGGLGDAVLAALSQERISAQKLAVREVARSGKPEELVDRFGLSSRHIVTAVRKALA